MSALGSGHRTQGLGRWPHGEGRGRPQVQVCRGEAGRGQQAVPLQEAGKQQEELNPSQALPDTDPAACKRNRGTVWGARPAAGGETLGEQQLAEVHPEG